MPETWGDYYGRMLDGPSGYLPETQRLARGEDAAQQRTVGFLTDTFNERGGGYLEDRDINRMYAGAADEASKSRMAAYRSLRQGMGARGISGGGYATGLGARIEMERMSNLATQMRGLKQFQATFNAEQGQRRMQGAGMIGNAMMQGPSDAYAQGLTNVLGLQVTREGLERQERMGQVAADATKEAGKKQFLGNLAGGVIGAIGSAF